MQQAPLQLAFVRERDARSGARGDCDRGGDDWREGRDHDGGPAGEGQVCPPPVAPGTPWPPSLPPLEGPTRVWVTLGSPLVCARPQLVGVRAAPLLHLVLFPHFPHLQLLRYAANCAPGSPRAPTPRCSIWTNNNKQ